MKATEPVPDIYAATGNRVDSRAGRCCLACRTATSSAAARLAAELTGGRGTCILPCGPPSGPRRQPPRGPERARRTRPQTVPPPGTRRRAARAGAPPWSAAGATRRRTRIRPVSRQDPRQLRRAASTAAHRPAGGVLASPATKNGAGGSSRRPSRGRDACPRGPGAERTDQDAQADHRMAGNRSRNGSGLDNQRSNLRPATKAQNNHNQRPYAVSSSRYKGVTWHRKVGKWLALQAHHNAAGPNWRPTAAKPPALNQPHPEPGRTIQPRSTPRPGKPGRCRMNAWLRPSMPGFRPGRPGAPERERRRPCGCLSDPAVFGHACGERPPRRPSTPSCGRPGCLICGGAA